MEHRDLRAILGVLACCAVAGSSQAAPIVGIANFPVAPRMVDHVWCCRYHHRYYYRHLRWYWTPEPYNRHFDLYYGWLAAEPARSARYR